MLLCLFACLSVPPLHFETVWNGDFFQKTIFLKLGEQHYLDGLGLLGKKKKKKKVVGIYICCLVKISKVHPAKYFTFKLCKISFSCIVQSILKSELENLIKQQRQLFGVSTSSGGWGNLTSNISRRRRTRLVFNRIPRDFWSHDCIMLISGQCQIKLCHSIIPVYDLNVGGEGDESDEEYRSV